MYREDQYDKKILRKHISEHEFKLLIGDLNHTLGIYWPCNSFFRLGYLAAPLTLGISFNVPNVCVSEA